MKSVKASVAIIVAVAIAVAGVIIWSTQRDSSSDSDATSRQKNTAFIPSSLDKTWGTDGYSLMTQASSIEVADTASTLAGVTYSVGTMSTQNGLRAVVFRTVNGKTYDVKYAVNPLKERLLGLGAFSSSVGRKISVDNAGNVWVVLSATTSTGTPTEHWAVTQLKPNLDYWGTETSALCSSVCGTVYASSISIHDIQVNIDGNKVLVATSAGMNLFNATAGRPLPVGTISLTTGPNAVDCKMTPTMLAADEADGFIAVSQGGSRNVVMITFDGHIPACQSTFFLSSISSVHVTGGNVTVFGKYFKNVSFVSLYMTSDSLLYMDDAYVSVEDLVGDKTLITGQAVGFIWDVSYGTFTVQGDVPETYLVEYNSDGNNGRGQVIVFASLTNTATARAVSQPPMLTVSRAGLVVTSSFTDESSNGTAIAVRYAVPNGSLLAAPTFYAVRQNITVTYGQSNSIPVARAINAESYSLASGSLPAGMTLTPSGDLVGSPLSVGNYTATIAATNPAGSAQTVLYIRSAAKLPGAPNILGVEYGSPVTLIGYVEGAKGSDKDVVSAHFTAPDGTAFNQQCSNGTCVIVNRNLAENADVPVTLKQSNETGATESLNSVIVRRNVLPEPHTNVSVKGDPLRATVTYTPSADMHGVDALTTSATVTRSSDKSVVKSFWGCSPESCVLEGLPAGSGYVVALTIVTEIGNVTSQPSAPFSVTEPAPEKKAPQLATEDLSLLAREDFVLPLVATGTGDIRFDVNYDDLVEGLSYDAEMNTITGAVNAGTYVVRYSATDRNGTTEGSVTITATPSKLRAPGMLPAFNTYDQKFSVYPFYKRDSDMSAVSQFEWTSTVTVDGAESTTSGTCVSHGKCTLPNAVWGQELTLTLKALPIADLGDTESDVNTFIIRVPELPAAVPTGKISFERMPDTNPETAVIMGSVRMKPSMRFPLALSETATVQVDATTSCDVINQQTVLRLEGPRNGCSVDPYVNVLRGNETVASDDDGGVASIPTGTDEEGNETIDTYNMLSSRLSTVLEPGEYTIEASTFVDLFKDDVLREDSADVEYDLWLTIITTPAEAERLMKTDVVGKASTETVETTVAVLPDPAKEDVIPADLQPAKSNALPGSEGAGGASAASVSSLTVEAGIGKLAVTPNTLGGGTSASVTITANPSGRGCTTSSGTSCTISGLSPWISYTLTAKVTGGQGQLTTTARPTLQWKAGSTVKVSSLGLSTAAKATAVNLKKGGIRVSGSCRLNAARTSIAVGKAGSCRVVVQTTQKAKPKLAGAPLSATAVIK